jgi:hypothetical protein
MKTTPVIPQRYIYGTFLLIATILFFVFAKDLFFYDEDIFIADTASDFMTQLWQRGIICKVSYWGDNYFYGNHPFGYHAANFVLHIANTGLATLVLIELLKACKIYFTSFQLKFIPVIFFLLFLFSPVHSEPLGYILARCGTLVSFFCLLSVLFLLKSHLKNKIFIFYSLLFFFIALFTYEISWMLPFVIAGIIVFLRHTKTERPQKTFLVALPYFFIFGAWFIIKVVFIDKFVVSDYADADLFKISFVTLVKNTCTLFLRNFIPPFKDSANFISAGIILMILMAGALIKLFFYNRKILLLSILLLVTTFLSFAAVVTLGIDTHDSESERYIYFSSCFGLMLVALLLGVLVKNRVSLFVITSACAIWYGSTLFTTINYYNQAGSFSAKYIAAIHQINNKPATVFVINLPAQYQGALLYRAKSRISGNTKNSITTLNEFIQYRYKDTATKYVAVTVTEIYKVPGAINIYYKPMDSLSFYFPAANTNVNSTVITTQKGEFFNFVKAQSAFIALKDSGLYIFN